MASAAPKLLLSMLLVALCSSCTHALVDNIVTQWINATAGVVATVGIQNQLSTKYYGLVGLAIHQSLQKGGAPDEALAAFAGHAIVSASFPWSQGPFDVLIAKQVAKFSSAELDKAEAVAVPIAEALLRDRIGDGSTRWARFKPFPAGTQWRYQFVPNQTFALYPQLATTKPFLNTNEALKAISGNTDAKAGPVFKPPRDDYTPTYEQGAKKSSKRTAYQTDSAWFWAQGANTSTIAGQWLEIARQLLPSSYSLKDTALFYARAGTAAYDASIAGWQVKYTTLAWRPITAFRAGYPGFEKQPEWTPLLKTPLHPEYLSGHQVTVGALLEVILAAVGKDKVTFTVTSEGAPWVGERKYDSLTAAAVEVGDSRKWGGVHFPSSNEDGLKLGRLVAKGTLTKLGPGAAAAKPAAGVKLPATGRRLL